MDEQKKNAEKLVELCEKSIKICKNNPRLFDDDEDLNRFQKELEIAKHIRGLINNQKVK
jgi:hypothetical protein